MAMEKSWSGLVSFLEPLAHDEASFTVLTTLPITIVIVLIAAEILVALINILVDLYAGE